MSGLARVLTLRDVVFFLVVAVIGPRWIATAAAVGPSALTIWVIGAVAFFLPLAFTVSELSARYPHEGGLYVWTREAFGERAAFLTGWLYWTTNLLYFPGLLYFAAGNLLYAGPSSWLRFEHSAPYFLLASFVGLAIAVAPNVRGVSWGRWLQNVSAVGTWVPLAILVCAGVVAAVRFGPATRIDIPSLHPHTSLRDLVLWSTIAFGFAGIEAASLMGDEIRDARRTLPRAFVIGGACIAFFYIAGTVAVLLALPASDVSGLAGISQATTRTAERVGWPALGRASAALLAISSIGGVGAWLASVARLPFVAGVDRALPSAFARVHPRWGTPVFALLVQAAGCALFIAWSQAGSSVQAAYDVLVSTTTVVYFLPYIAMFATLIRVQRVAAPAGAVRVPGGAAGAYVCGTVGLLVTAASIVLACLPASPDVNALASTVKVLGATGVLILLGVVLQRRQKTAS